MSRINFAPLEQKEPVISIDDKFVCIFGAFNGSDVCFCSTLLTVQSTCTVKIITYINDNNYSNPSGLGSSENFPRQLNHRLLQRNLGESECRYNSTTSYFSITS